MNLPFGTGLRFKLRLGIGIACAAGLSVASLEAASEGAAEFTRVINEVTVLPEQARPAPASVGDRIDSGTAVSTGLKSRAELRFPDKTLTRLGATSVFRMDQETKTVDLDKGVILLQVPKQLGGAKIRTAAVTAAVTGTTVIVEFMPDGFIKIIVIEGEVDVFLNERQSIFRTLTPGDLWITKSDDKSGLPLPVKVDLQRLKKTSKLMDDDLFSPLGNEDHVEAALSSQAKKKQDGELLATAFRIEGRGRQVTLTQGERQHVLGIAPPPPPRIVAPVIAPVKPKIAVAGPDAPERPTEAITNPERTVFEDGSTIRTGAPILAYNSEAGTYTPLAGTEYIPAEDAFFNSYMYGEDPPAAGEIDELLATRGSWFVFKGDEIFIAGNPAVDSSGGPRDLILGATGDVRFTADPPFEVEGIETGDLWALDGNTDGLVLTSNTGSIDFVEFSLTGTTQEVAFFAIGAASDVNVLGGGASLARISVPDGSFQAQAGRDVVISGATVEARDVTLTGGRDVRVGSAESGGATVAAAGSVHLLAERNVTISNTSQLRRLTQLDNPHVLIESVNGNIEIIDGSSIEADVANLLAQRGNINILNSSISAREIGARVLDTGGTLLIGSAALGNGANPADLIRLYGEGAGGVRFTGVTTLLGNSVDIAGTSVTIDPGSRVRLSNPPGTRVYSDAHNYNSRNYGVFTGLDNSQGGGGPVEVNRHDYASRPAY